MLDELERIRENIFRYAWVALWDLDSDKWHRIGGEIDAYKRHSSQALAIDYFGTLMFSEEKASILNSLAARLGLPSSKDWEVELEWGDGDNLLHETRKKTQVDAVACSSEAIIFFECKFKESAGGSCSQTKYQCDGNYRMQINPENGVQSRCALSGKGIRYWDVIPDLFKLESIAEYEPCPFSGSNYQWMRNLVVCTQVAKKKGLAPHFLIVYANAPGLPIADKIRSDNLCEFRAFLKDDGPLFSCMSYQELLNLSIESVTVERPKFLELNRWIRDKISNQIRFVQGVAKNFL